MAKADKNFYLKLAKDIYNGLEEPRYGFDWVVERLMEIAREWHYGHARMVSWANQMDSTNVFDKLYETEWEDIPTYDPRYDDERDEIVTISLLTGERKVWKRAVLTN